MRNFMLCITYADQTTENFEVKARTLVEARREAVHYAMAQNKPAYAVREMATR